jgi:uncharacterized protein (DUF697 family)
MNDTLNWVNEVLRGTGRAVETVAGNPLVRTVGGWVGLGQLVNAIDRVDVAEVDQSVQDLRAQHPSETPAQIASRVVAEKSLYAGGLGAASSVLPGFLAGLLAVDIAANLLLQAQMIYQVAAAYGLDLRAPERKGEVVLVFVLAFGGNQALRLGSGLVGRLPVLGTAVSAGANAASVWILGQVACRFYEAQLSPSPVAA